MENALIHWSGGKDSALSLYRLLQNKEYNITNLLTSLSAQYQRISMHGVREALLDEQARSIGIPLVKMYIPEMPSMEIYEQTLAAALTELKNKGTSVSVFGDIFLEDLRTYRENKLGEIGVKAHFPLWGQPTQKLIYEFIDSGFKAVITCVNERCLDKSFVGRNIDEAFLKDLPENVDPCGENGEFHSFVYDGPVFKKPVRFVGGEVVYRKYNSSKNDSPDEREVGTPFDYGFWYFDLQKVESVVS
ncbi:MAG: diphthine--ammonia ligase [Bacteroidetes bacterium]|nr:diphthine--ammonia ligase [Bacteroidota bacterium]